MADAEKDAAPEEIVSWNVEADRIAKEISAKDDSKMSDDGMDGFEGSLSS